jgi:hypothetical protein
MNLSRRVDAASHANAIASILTPICRPAVKGPTPLALYDATTQGTGKTLLSEVVSLITSGREGAPVNLPVPARGSRLATTSNSAVTCRVGATGFGWMPNVRSHFSVPALNTDA